MLMLYRRYNMLYVVLMLYRLYTMLYVSPDCIPCCKSCLIAYCAVSLTAKGNKANQELEPLRLMIEPVAHQGIPAE